MSKSKTVTRTLWNKIEKVLHLCDYSSASYDKNSSRSLVNSSGECLSFDHGAFHVSHTCLVDIAQYEGDNLKDTILLIEFKIGNVNETEIYRKSVESILGKIKYLSGDPKFNPFDYNFAFYLVYNEEAISPGAKRMRERTFKKPYYSLLKPLENHLYKKAIPLTVDEFIVKFKIK